MPIIRKIFPVNGNKTILLREYSIKFYISSIRDRMQAMIYYFNEYEPDVSKLINDNLSEGDCFFDVGSSAGYFSLIAAKKVGVAGSVHAFDPLPRNCELFERNKAINGFNNITINRVAVTDHVGRSIFYPPRDSDEWGTGSLLDGDKIKSFDIPSLTLGHYVKSRNIKTINLIKIDAEGSELKIIRGMAPVISDAGFPKIICEINKPWLKLAGCEPADLIHALEGIGYKIYKVERGRLSPIGRNSGKVFNVFATH